MITWISIGLFANLNLLSHTLHNSSTWQTWYVTCLTEKRTYCCYGHFKTILLMSSNQIYTLSSQLDIFSKPFILPIRQCFFLFNSDICAAFPYLETFYGYLSFMYRKNVRIHTTRNIKARVLKEFVQKYFLLTKENCMFEILKFCELA